MSLSLFSLNIEADKHKGSVEAYLKTNEPDVVFLQEVYKIHAQAWATQFGYHLSFAPHVDFNIYEHIFKPLGEWGIATLTKLKPTKVKIDYYTEPPVVIPHEFMKTKKHPRALLVTELAADTTHYTFATTHFTWALTTDADVAQREDYQRFQTLLDQIPSFVLAGDLNADRTSMVYKELAHRYQDHLPPDLSSTLDPVLFRKPELKLVVDHLFSTADYKISNVQVLTGLSDHCGLSATISK
ncbi:MAG: hypothetical protein DPW11_01850 [bacterium]|nr:hypothetical protein [bacterium]RIK51543.1 MAG: hypothetical protein DCC61_02335 [Candidatus Microgenomates bacterium]